MKTEQLETAIKLDARSIRVVGSFADIFRKTFKMKKTAKGAIAWGVVSIARYLLQHLSQVVQV